MIVRFNTLNSKLGILKVEFYFYFMRDNDEYDEMQNCKFIGFACVPLVIKLLFTIQTQTQDSQRVLCISIRYADTDTFIIYNKFYKLTRIEERNPPNIIGNILYSTEIK